MTGPTGPTGGGSGGGSACEAKAGTLPVGATEVGAWSATIHAETADKEVQTQAALSFPCRLSEEQGLKLKIRYLDKAEVAAVTLRKECPGNAEQPKATEGWLCIFNGATATAGSLESEWKNWEAPTGSPVTNTFIEDTGGNQCVSCTSPSGITDFSVGALVVYRNQGYVEGAPETANPAATILNADGSFAVTAKE